MLFFKIICHTYSCWGGGNLTPPPYSFFTLLKKYWSEADEIFWLFLHTQSPSFRPTFTCQILIKFCFFKSLWHKETNCLSFAKKIENFLQKFLHILNGMVKGFSKMYNFSFFGQVFFCKHLYYITGFCDKKFNFCKSANFLQILKVETRAFQWCIICHIWTSNMGFRASISWFSSTPAKIWLTLSRLS